MGNSGGRPSCLGVKSQRAEDFLKDSYLKDMGLDAGPPSGRNNAEGHAGPSEKPPLTPVVIENGWPLAQQSSPLPKQDNRDVIVQSRGLACPPLKAHLEATWSSPVEGLLQRRGAASSWAWKPLEVTEVTEVTETVVTEIVEVTEYPGGDKSQEPVVTRTVKVLTECAGARPEVNSGAALDEAGPAEGLQSLLWRSPFSFHGRDVVAKEERSESRQQVGWGGQCAGRPT